MEDSKYIIKNVAVTLIWSALITILMLFVLKYGSTNNVTAWLGIGSIFFLFIYLNMWSWTMSQHIIKRLNELEHKINTIGQQITDIWFNSEKKKGKVY